jgi:hypothetical protein
LPFFLDIPRATKLWQPRRLILLGQISRCSLNDPRLWARDPAILQKFPASPICQRFTPRKMANRVYNAARWGAWQSSCLGQPP